MDVKLSQQELERVEQIMDRSGCTREAAEYVVAEERGLLINDVLDEQPDSTFKPAP